MIRIIQIAVSAMITIAVSWAIAGGSFEIVQVKELRISGETDYELVVLPLKQLGVGWYKDPFMGSCETFTVHGTYSSLYSAFRFPEFVTKDAHLAALTHLRQAHALGHSVNLGYMGKGFVPVDPAAPCAVRSRALNLQTEGGETVVISYHDAV